MGNSDEESAPPQGLVVIWTGKEINALRKRANALVSCPSDLKAYAVAEFAEHTLLLGEVAKKFLQDAAGTLSAADAAKLATAGESYTGSGAR